ncbi:MAG: Branched-chain amino acid transport system 2 carrier protein [Chlamydiales bacterium]|nr:Branched-chain amino acid transport system 2 carrier protein [Chlamydiales bacterium]MCH9620346.1 Branched-chain amino acid transport system 2 carrier protein [Chlamydiales bacterium]MCH9622332.1 Branched-chain amino acid transport system 2 carrier protein [Chlamydiales bacterium]
MKKYLSISIVGISLFSMFFGGGNLVFPLFSGIHSHSLLLTIIGFLVTGVLLPFLGVTIGMLFEGDYEEFFGVLGKRLGAVLIFTFLLCWIPLGSGPRCSLLSYGAFCQIGGEAPIWLYTAAYSVLVYFLTCQKRYFISILGKFITPALLFSLFCLVIYVFKQGFDRPFVGNMTWNGYYTALIGGYSTMDFVAAIFFSSTIITLLKNQQKEEFEFKSVYPAFLIAVFLLTIVYIEMICIGYMKSEELFLTDPSQLLAAISYLIYGEQMKYVVFAIISLSVLSTSMALSLVYAEYLHQSIFKKKINYNFCLIGSVLFSYILSTIGFEKLAVFISYVMGFLYPFLLLLSIIALFKKLRVPSLKLQESPLHETE